MDKKANEQWRNKPLTYVSRRGAQLLFGARNEHNVYAPSGQLLGISAPDTVCWTSHDWEKRKKGKY